LVGVPTTGVEVSVATPVGVEVLVATLVDTLVAVEVLVATPVGVLVFVATPVGVEVFVGCVVEVGVGVVEPQLPPAEVVLSLSLMGIPGVPSPPGARIVLPAVPP
jgi:hypothetical protein